MEDLVHLDGPTEATVVAALRERYATDKIYTGIADLLIAVNPFKKIPDPSSLDGPHPFKTAMAAYAGLTATGRPQAILISGESGAGKTESCKLCLNQLSSTSKTDVANRLLRANPILESLGNAKTVRNDNSSRFGKFMQIHFDTRSLAISGCDIVDYLLEKSRVITPGPDERSYHIFYQLLTEKEEDPATYPHLARSGCTEIQGVDDAAQWRDFLDGLDRLGCWTHEERTQLLDACAAVLSVAAVAFDENTDQKRRRSFAAGTGNLLKAAAKLGIDSATLAHVLTHRTITVGGEECTTNLSIADARDCRDATAKHVYGALFRATVRRVNYALLKNGSSASSSKVIGLLDIFGFEIFDKNSFEQLCINYCNEKLQRHFAMHVFDKEIELYKREGAPFEGIHYADNADLLELVESRKIGLFRMLDDEVKAPGASDRNYCAKIQKRHQHQRLAFDRRRPDEVFELRHYAGVVRYDVEGFVVKNKDRLYDDVSTALTTSTNGLLASLFKTEDDDKKMTASYRFVAQLGDLMRVLDASDPHYIRCIKPNAEKVPGRFENEAVQAQLLFGGCFEAVAIRQQGFPFRAIHEAFHRRFAPCVPHAVKNCAELVNLLDVPGCVVGTTLVLWRSPEERVLQKARRIIENAKATVMTALVRRREARGLWVVLTRARQLYEEALRRKDPSFVDAAVEEIGTPRFESRDVRRLRKMKTRFQREWELEAEYDRLAALPVNDAIKDDHFEKLVEEGRQLELDSPNFIIVNHLYATVIERNSAVAAVRRELEDDEPDEVVLRDALVTLERLVRTFGKNMSTPEETEVRSVLATLAEETRVCDLVCEAIRRTKIPSMPYTSTTFSLSPELEIAAKDLKELRSPRKHRTHALVDVVPRALAQRYAIAEALKTDDDDDKWDLARQYAVEAMNLDCCVDEVLGAVHEDSRAITELCDARGAVVDACRRALATSPPSEAALREAIECAAVLDDFVGLGVAKKEVDATRRSLERLLAEKKCLKAVMDALRDEALPEDTEDFRKLPWMISTVTLETAIGDAEKLGMTDPRDGDTVLAAAAVLALREALKVVAGITLDDFIQADTEVRRLRDAVTAVANQQQVFDDWAVTRDLELADRGARMSSVRFLICETIEEACGTFQGGEADDDAVCKLQRGVAMARALDLEHECKTRPHDVLKCLGDDDKLTVSQLLAVIERGEATVRRVESTVESLEAAMAAVDEALLGTALTEAICIGYGGYSARAARALWEAVRRVIDDAKAAPGTLDLNEMRRVVEEAHEINFTNEHVRKVEAYLSLGDEAAIAETILVDAIEDKDRDLALTASLKLGHSDVDLAACPSLRTPLDFAGVRFTDPKPDVRTRKTMSSMLSFADALPSSLTRGIPRDTARALFNIIHTYMGDSVKSSKTTSDDVLINACRQDSDLVDEAYAQILKQITNNPRASSRDRGWRLIGALVDAHLGPSTSMLPPVESQCHRRDSSFGSPLAPRLVMAWLDYHFLCVENSIARGWLDISLNGCSSFNDESPKKRRYFILDDAILRYYDAKPDDDDMKKPSTSHKVSSIRQARALYSDRFQQPACPRRYHFVVDMVGDVTVRLAAQSAEERAYWVAALRSRISI